MRFITYLSPVKPCLVKYFKWLLKGSKSKGLAKAHFVYTSHKGYIGSPKGTVPSREPSREPSSRGLVRTLILMGHHVLYLLHAHTDHDVLYTVMVVCYVW